MTYFIDNQTFGAIGKGIFPINKRKGMTSAEVVERVKAAIMKGVNTNDRRHLLKVGHGGTLDKTATGVLVIGLCWGCKLLSQLLHGDKSYRVQAKLGTATDTFNETGKVTHKADYSYVARQKLVSALPQYLGKIYQKPPVYSALKRGGIRLSDIARSGQNVEVQARPVECYSIECISFAPPHFTLDISCGGGFYIRSLIHDLGISMGTFAHVTELCRTRQGPFKLNDCIEYDSLNLETIMYTVSKSYKHIHGKSIY